MVSLLHDQSRRSQYGRQGDLHLGRNARSHYRPTLALLPRGKSMVSFVVQELTVQTFGRTYWEVDELYERKIPAWRFKSTKTLAEQQGLHGA